jgi:hypothetical protein
MIPELADDPDWYKTQCRLFDNDQRKIAQELELKFLPSEGSFFESDTVEKVQNAVKIPMEKMRIFNGELWKFSNTLPNRYYIMGVDTAPEHGEDKSAITVWDYETMEQVAEYQGKSKVLDFVKVVKVLASQYPGLIIVESNSYGNQVVEQLYASEFSTMIYKEKRGQQTLLPGLATTSKTRPLMIDALYSYITQFPEIIKSERLALEIAGLVSKPNGRVEADIGCHDDLVLASSCVMYVRKYDPPMLVGTAEFSSIQSEITEALKKNLSVTGELTNESIMRTVKDNIKDMGGFIDTLTMFERR